jgi:hypothetical protein
MPLLEQKMRCEKRSLYNKLCSSHSSFSKNYGLLAYVAIVEPEKEFSPITPHYVFFPSCTNLHRHSLIPVAFTVLSEVALLVASKQARVITVAEQALPSQKLLSPLPVRTVGRLYYSYDLGSSSVLSPSN